VELRHLDTLLAIADEGSFTAAADALSTVQSNVSEQVRQLEEELGVPIFIRQGKRLTTLTAGGEVIVASARRALQELNNLRHIGAEFKSEDTGTLAIATTHLQARYVLPPVLKRFTERYPKVRVLLHQGDPVQVGKQTAHEVVYDASMRGFAQGKTFEQALMEHPRVEGALATEELKSLLDPTTYVGLAPAIVDRVLAETRASGWIKSL